MDGSFPGDRTPGLPSSIGVVAAASIASQLVALLAYGPKDENGISYVLSMLLGGLLLGWVGAGVTRARTVRLALAWVLLGLSAVFGTLGLVDNEGADAAYLASLVLTFVSLGALWAFHRTEWFAWQRTRPATDQGEPITTLVAMGVAVGVLGGIIPLQHATGFHITIGGSSDDSEVWEDWEDEDPFSDDFDEWE